MKIAIIDADLIGRKKQRFPNLACEKISGYYKDKFNAEVELKLDYDNLDAYDQVFISKVFTDTWVPKWIMTCIDTETCETSLPPNIRVGGTGFFFDHAPDLDYEIEHHMPDYHLYDSWIKSEVDKARKEKGESFNEKQFMVQFKEYTDYSIGFLTRGCFRKCEFCVNKKYDHVFIHSPLDEFYDPSRKKICFLDDNFWGCKKSDRTELFRQIMDTNRQFKFKQGMDERLLTDEVAELLFGSKYDGDFTFAFDNIADYDLIHKKLEIIRRHTKRKGIMFYVLVGFESTDADDIVNAFKRIELLMQYKCIPYIMRYQSAENAPWKESKYRGLYVSIARWCNQPSIFKKMSFRQFCVANQALHKTEGTLCSSMQALVSFEAEYPKIAERYFDLRYEDY
ncbi:hypothetical protein ACQRAR_07765 [Anaerovoracaceae bacterium SGI.174]